MNDKRKLTLIIISAVLGAVAAISVPLSMQKYEVKGLFIPLIFVIAIGIIDRYYKSKK